MRRAIVCVLALAACDPIWSLRAGVKSPTGQPLDRAALVLTGCPDQNSHDLGTIAALTDGTGSAAVGGLGAEYPACTVTIAKPGYVTQQFTFDDLCKGDRSSCERVQDHPIVLQPEP